MGFRAANSAAPQLRILTLTPVCQKWFLSCWLRGLKMQQLARFSWNMLLLFIVPGGWILAPTLGQNFHLYTRNCEIHECLMTDGWCITQSAGYVSGCSRSNQMSGALPKLVQSHLSIWERVIEMIETTVFYTLCWRERHIGSKKKNIVPRSRIQPSALLLKLIQSNPTVLP